MSLRVSVCLSVGLKVTPSFCYTSYTWGTEEKKTEDKVANRNNEMDRKKEEGRRKEGKENVMMLRRREEGKNKNRLTRGMEERTSGERGERGETRREERRGGRRKG